MTGDLVHVKDVINTLELPKDKLILNIALQDAVIYNKENIVDYLLYKGADPNYVNKFGETSLALAIQPGNRNIIKLLLDRGALPNDRINNSDMNDFIKKYLASKKMRSIRAIGEIGKTFGLPEDVETVISGFSTGDSRPLHIQTFKASQNIHGFQGPLYEPLKSTSNSSSSGSTSAGSGSSYEDTTSNSSSSGAKGGAARTCKNKKGRSSNRSRSRSRSRSRRCRRQRRSTQRN